MSQETDNFRKAISALVALRERDLGRREVLGSRNFEEYAPRWVRAIDLWAEFGEIVPLDELPIQIVTRSQDEVDDFRSKLQKVLNLTGGVDMGVVSSLANELDNAINTAWVHVGPMVSFFRGEVDVPESKRQEIRREFAGFEQRAAILEDLLRKREGETGVAWHAAVFKNQADHHSRWSKVWLAVTILVTILIAGLAGGLALYYLRTAEPIDAGRTVQAAIAKLLLFSILYTSLVLSGRNYRAHRHNEEVNRHRHNALRTFETFVNAAGGDSDTRNAILLRTTETIFEPVQTGYLTNEPEGPQTTQILEILRSTTGKGT